MPRKTTAVCVALVSVLFAALAALISCGGGSETPGTIGVAVTILPQAEFVDSVGGEKVEVTVMVPPGADVHVYEPTPGQMLAVSRASMYVKVGSGMEFEMVWMNKLEAANREMLVVDSSRGIRMFEAGESGGGDPHIWLSPLNAMTMVRNICDGLIEVDPENRVYYERNRDAYLGELDILSKAISNELGRVGKKQFIVLHPAWSYLARDYGLEQIPIEVEGKEPSGKDIVRVTELAREHDIDVVFAEPQFNPQSADVIADEIGGRVVFIDPLARDYIDNMRTVLNQLVEGME